MDQRAALERGDEVHRAQRADVVSERGVKHASLSVAEHHELRFVAAGALVRGIGKGRGQDGHVPPRPAQRRVELVALVHEARGADPW